MRILWVEYSSVYKKRTPRLLRNGVLHSLFTTLPLFGINISATKISDPRQVSNNGNRKQHLTFQSEIHQPLPEYRIIHTRNLRHRRLALLLFRPFRRVFVFNYCSTYYSFPCGIIPPSKPVFYQQSISYKNGQC